MRDALDIRIRPLTLLRFALPTVVMMVFMALYTIVDGMFVSRLIDTDALSAVNIVYPLSSIVQAIGIMIGTGGSAVLAKKRGEGKAKEADRDFSFFLLVSVLVGVGFSALVLFYLRPILYLLGANEAIFHYCYAYMRPLVFFFTASILQLEFQFFLVTAGKPALGLVYTVAGGMANIVLDYVFIALLDMGIAGAAMATGIGYCIPAVGGLLYFATAKGDRMRLRKPRADLATLLKGCANGSSEMVSNLSGAVVAFVFNILMMRYLGQDGVAAITIVLYSEFLLVAVHLGFTSGVAPLISYNYGRRDEAKLQRIYSLCLRVVGVVSLASFALALLLAKPITGFFTAPGTPVYMLAVHGFYLYSLCYLFKGYNIFASGLFTALNNGRVSALLSFLRTLGFILLCIFTLSALFGVDGIWLAVPAAETLSLIVSLFFLRWGRGVYRYGREKGEV